MKGRDTRLLFCTTGILLRRLLVDRNLQGVTHVIVDEIHERGMNEGNIIINALFALYFCGLSVVISKESVSYHVFTCCRFSFNCPEGSSSSSTRTAIGIDECNS